MRFHEFFHKVKFFHHCVPFCDNNTSKVTSFIFSKIGKKCFCIPLRKFDNNIIFLFHFCSLFLCCILNPQPFLFLNLRRDNNSSEVYYQKMVLSLNQKTAILKTNVRRKRHTSGNPIQRYYGFSFFLS